LKEKRVRKPHENSSLSAENYFALADVLEHISSSECEPALWKNRFRVALQLRVAACHPNSARNKGMFIATEWLLLSEEGEE
jgi:hypothetical protein